MLNTILSRFSIDMKRNGIVRDGLIMWLDSHDFHNGSDYGMPSLKWNDRSSGGSYRYHNELDYSEDNWSGWESLVGATVVDKALVVKNNSANLSPMIPMYLKPNTLYGALVYVRTNTRSNATLINAPNSDGRPFSTVSFKINAGTTGNMKFTGMTRDAITKNMLFMWIEPNGGTLEVSSYRIFELPAGSIIARDFNLLTADKLAAKYHEQSKDPGGIVKYNNDASAYGFAYTNISGADYSDRSIKFDGVDSYFSTPAIIDNFSCTYEAVVEFNSIGTEQVIVGKEFGAKLTIDSDGYLHAYISADGQSWSIDVQAWMPEPLELNVKHHVAFVLDNEENMCYIFLDGSRVCSSNTEPCSEWNNNPVQIGASLGTNEMFKGKMYIVRVYNRALTYSEIQNNFMLSLS